MGEAERGKSLGFGPASLGKFVSYSMQIHAKPPGIEATQISFLSEGQIFVRGIATVFEIASVMECPEGSVLEWWAILQSLESQGWGTVLLAILQTKEMSVEKHWIQPFRNFSTWSSFFYDPSLCQLSQQTPRKVSLRKDPHENHWWCDNCRSGQNLRNLEARIRPSLFHNWEETP